MKKFQILPFLIFIFFSCKKSTIDSSSLNGYWIVKVQPREHNYRGRILLHFHKNKLDSYNDVIGHTPIHDYKIKGDSIFYINSSKEIYSSFQCQKINTNIILTSKYEYTDTLYRISDKEAKEIILELTDDSHIEVELPRTKINK